MADMKQQLARLICSADDEVLSVPYISTDGAHAIADYLVDHGVTLNECEVGTIVFALWDVPTSEKYVIYCAEVKEIYRSVRNCRKTTTYRLEPIEFRGRRKEYRDDEFGKTVFLTRAEAELALAKL